MAATHVAILRSSARIAQQQKEEKLDPTQHGQSENELSNHMSVISLSSSEGDDLSHASAGIRGANQQNKTGKYGQRVKTRPMVASLGQIQTVSDIDNCFDRDLHQLTVLERLEQKWLDISNNLNNVISHLDECSGQVTNASICCLEALDQSVKVTCDKADEQVNTLNLLMAKCDELGTKISVASTFCDEIKTLRKSIDTLENLYKTRPQRLGNQ